MALALLSAVPAHAVLPPCVYEDMVRAADTVVQITDISVQMPDAQGICLISGRVAHILRGEAVAGEVLTLPVACENASGMVGPQLYRGAEAMAAAAFIELHLEGGAITGHGAGLVIPDADAVPGEELYTFGCTG